MFKQKKIPNLSVFSVNKINLKLLSTEHKFIQHNNCFIRSAKCLPPFLSAAGAIDPMAIASLLPNANADDCEIKPGIAEMIREEERVSSTNEYLNL